MPLPSSFRLTALLLLPIMPAAQAMVRLPRLVSSHMVLQRNVPLPLWGWATPGEAVRVSFRGTTVQANAGPDGRWQLTLPARPAGGPFELEVKGQNVIKLTDVLVGDVWLASGQSNMEWPLREAAGGPAAAAAAHYPRIRLFNVPNRAEPRPQAELAGGEWRVCTPQSAADFSAVAYFFGLDLQRQYNVPVGLIAAEWGGTVAEAWTSAPTLQKLPDFQASVAALQRQPGSFTEQEAAYAARLQAWQQSPAGQDQGLLPGQPSWADPNLATPSWNTLQLPGLWESQTPELRDFDGVVWLRRELTLPASAANQPLTLSLAQVDDQDSTFFNGVAIGGTRGYDKLRRYTVPASLVRAGRNVVAVRVTDTGSGGGLWGKPENLTATVGSLTVPLAGSWQYRPAFDPSTRPRSPFPGGPQNEPTSLFNGMIAPLAPYALKGVIWYQGESNAGRDAQYRVLFPALVQDWRTHWQQAALPFLFVQLAGYMPDAPEPTDTDWARLREAQRLTSLRVPRTGMAVALDLGNPDDIHPRNKQDVGHRLALQARRVAYGETSVVASGPTFEKLSASGNRLTLSFGNVGGGLLLRPGGMGTLSSFAVAGPDGRFVWAQAEVEGTTLVLHADGVANPVAVRYAWGNNRPATLYNKEGLPASPFRSDDWPRQPAP
ncbi:sialate O-acetylesterase [Hymenobacter sp. HSC-4F20]|uniref:sialate O-acetylesterase n=1 Tax=Hymenobacter sp. HSC-4F20 TaxID=2864135 RepID=UPI001C73335C|nr:sialate O-acetylesterase [Hymenobacter sp. HSC-4F20]MBX0289259.1 sialate O-acetylesterase [Hymenobacter sp. HSC-4F20]